MDTTAKQPIGANPSDAKPADKSAALNLVTGGTGLLGSHIAEQLVQRGQRVRALVRPGSDTSFLREIGAELIEGNLNDADALRKACTGVQRVYHAAARVGDWGPWHEYVTYTIEGTRMLIDAAAEANVKRFLHISSISTYGHVNGDGLVLDETAPLGRNLHKWSYYSRAKVEADKLILKAHEQGRIVATIVRPSWMYGKRDRATMGRLIESIRKRKIKLLGKGDNQLNVSNAANVAECIILAAESDKGIGQAYNASSDGELTQAQYFNMIADALGEPHVTRRVPYAVAWTAAFVFECIGHALNRKRPPLVTRYSVWLIGRRCFFSCEKARKELGWKSRISYEEGIPAAVQEYLDREGTSSSHAAQVKIPGKQLAAGRA